MQQSMAILVYVSSFSMKGGDMKTSEELKKELIERLDLSDLDKKLIGNEINIIIYTALKEQINIDYSRFRKNMKSVFGKQK